MTTFPFATIADICEGGTWSIDPSLPVHTSGFYVALHGREETLPIGTLVGAAIQAYVARNADAFRDPRNYLGSWRRDDGSLVLDVSRHHTSYPDAVYAAIVNGQDAIWHIWLGEAVDTLDATVHLCDTWPGWQAEITDPQFAITSDGHDRIVLESPTQWVVIHRNRLGMATVLPFVGTAATYDRIGTAFRVAVESVT